MTQFVPNIWLAVVLLNHCISRHEASLTASFFRWRVVRKMILDLNNIDLIS